MDRIDWVVRRDDVTIDRRLVEKVKAHPRPLLFAAAAVATKLPERLVYGWANGFLIKARRSMVQDGN